MSKDGGPAFPVVGAAGATMDFGGMTLRDYFAAKAMQSLIAALTDESGIKREYAEPIAQGSYFMADAMLKAREQ